MVDNTTSGITGTTPKASPTARPVDVTFAATKPKLSEIGCATTKADPIGAVGSISTVT